jgi:hypothetical protein
LTHRVLVRHSSDEDQQMVIGRLHELRVHAHDLEADGAAGKLLG